MVRHLEQLRAVRLKNGLKAGSGNSHPHSIKSESHRACTDGFECVALHVSPDLGERIMLSGDRGLLDEVFPETCQAVIDARSGAASWNQQDHVIR